MTEFSGREAGDYKHLTYTAFNENKLKNIIYNYFISAESGKTLENMKICILYNRFHPREFEENSRRTSHTCEIWQEQQLASLLV